MQDQLQVAMVDHSDHREARSEPHHQVGGLEAVYMAQRPRLVRFLRARGAADEAEDLVQELWMKITAAPATPIADPVGYLFRAADNLMISRYRSTQRSGNRDNIWHDRTGEIGESAEETVAARLKIDKAWHRLDGLGQRVLKIFTMYRVDGIGQQQVATELGISLSLVEKDLQRAYRAIANLKDEFDAE
jgi:RNA polymerase sigma-70 factor (ECF subfamily)